MTTEYGKNGWNFLHTYGIIHNTIDESVLTVEYKFSYTSNGGLAQRSFTVPMTEETIAELIKVLENKLTASAFAQEQRTLMTKSCVSLSKIATISLAAFAETPLMLSPIYYLR